MDIVELQKLIDASWIVWKRAIARIEVGSATVEAKTVFEITVVRDHVPDEAHPQRVRRVAKHVHVASDDTPELVQKCIAAAIVLLDGMAAGTPDDTAHAAVDRNALAFKVPVNGFQIVYKRSAS